MKLDIKKPLLFTAILSPVIIVGTLFVGIYQFNSFNTEIQSQLLEQFGKYEIFLLGVTIQGLIIASACAFFGYILANKTGLLKAFLFERRKLIKTLIITIVGGVVFSFDYWTFGKLMPEINELTEATLTPVGFISAVLYGGIIEEILLRIFLMTLFVFLSWKIFFKNIEKEQIPSGIFIAANILSAILFAAGHLPATMSFFGDLTPLLIIRCFLFNGSFGIVFGWLYKKYGIQYAMVGHMGFHIISKLIWLIFI